MRLKVLFPLLLVTIMLQGCLGTMFTGTSRIVALQTSDGKPTKVEVSGAGGIQEITIPGSVTVQASKAPITVKVKDKCYDETTQMVPSKVNVVSLFDFLFGTIGTTGASVDSSNGSFWTYDNNVIVITSKNNTCK